MKNIAYVRFLNLVNQFHEEAQNAELERSIPLIAHVAEVEANHGSVRSTDIVLQQRFGTGPTVIRRIAYLCEMGYLKSTPSPTDRRVRFLSVTKKGYAVLTKITALMRSALSN